MIEINHWMAAYCEGVRESFGERVDFIGLQGSYGRGEAGEQSDLDVVLLLDKLEAADLRRYGEVLDTLPHRELVCGFAAGREELAHWDTADLFQFYFDTVPYMGSLGWLRERMDGEAAGRAIRLGACNLYHGCVHNLLHEKDAAILKGQYKAAVFVLQAIAYRQTGRYERQKSRLHALLQPAEQAILETAMRLKAMEEVPAAAFAAMGKQLFEWASDWIRYDGKADRA